MLNQTRPDLNSDYPDKLLALDRAALLVDTVCRLAGAENLISAESNRLRQAILNYDTPQLFKYLLEAFSLQGISDHAARSYMDHHGSPAWHDLQQATARPPACSKLRSYWSFHGCGYRKDSRTCAQPWIAPHCSLPRHDLRNGRLNQTTYSLFLFIRDVADGNLVEWVDQTLDQASLSSTAKHRASRMRSALIDPLRNVFGVSDKLLNMALADILMAAPSTKPTWIEVGSGMIAIDTLVHNFLLRTGIQRGLGAKHGFGPACYAEGGCAEIIRLIASRIDARQFNPDYPRVFPRFVQHAIWRYSAQLELNICNGNNIDDCFRCSNKGCPLFHRCDRVALHA
ncbi:hypothetical protein HAP48_0004380 [Bradyrhizobium septentrionale]|uniref:Uncharacterized protein n=1 Tax=Bradyrhizobium septentrionale TaxID=1404411 RepID=A0A973W5P6_9BRAD|nr:hypothetical protein [Bradyrhizobium septentrionale]UGY16783.1 hypothetical protein HAP48_0004380 [Bradyrhizobium septentrionale]